MESFKTAYDAYLKVVEQALPRLVPQLPKEDGGLVTQAARYSLLAGGKRVRPILCLATAEMLQVEVDRALPYACAIELIHTYSLIHDDLPCMDDDTWRRGRRTCHVVFGEAMAVLAGDALLNRAYEILLQATEAHRPESIAAAAAIAKAAGSRGMIGGQVLDLAAEKETLLAKQQEKLHRLKTGALLKAPVEAALHLARSDDLARDDLLSFADAIGLAFQIQDDILDATASFEKLGKSTGKDERDEKSTYVRHYGLDGAKARLSAVIEQGQASLRRLKEREKLDISFLQGLCQYLEERTS